MLTDQEIKHVARLARIKITEKEEEKFRKELSSILDYINKLNEINTEGVEPLYQTTGLVNSMRPDEHSGSFSSGGGSASGWEMDEDLNKKLIGQSPDKEKGFIRVRSVLGR